MVIVPFSPVFADVPLPEAVTAGKDLLEVIRSCATNRRVVAEADGVLSGAPSSDDSQRSSVPILTGDSSGGG
jgi:hypothetical protein